MSEITQPIEELINYDVLLERCFRGLIGAGPNLMLHRLFLSLSLTTGLKVSTLLTLKWKDILTLGSENNAVVKNELFVRKYAIPLHPRVKTLISDIYVRLGFPRLDSTIIAADDKPEYRQNYEYSEMLIKSGSLNSKAHRPSYNEYFSKLDSDRYLQVIFGRKVFETEGYSTKVCKKLKQHLALKTNKELLDFLGYKSIRQIKYELSSINITDDKIEFDGSNDTITVTAAIVELDDKNFNNKYPFQKFSAFANFLMSGNTFYREPITNSIRILLLLSLYNGIRPSTLIRLKWKDIVKIDKKKKTIQINRLSHFEGYHIKIGNESVQKLLYHLELSILRATGEQLSPISPLVRGYKKKPSFLAKPIFVTNADTQLTQPSLSREINKALNFWKFPFTERFTSKSTVIMYGRRIIEIKGDHTNTIKKLKQHFNFRSQVELFKFLYIDYKKIKGRTRSTIFEEILYDLK